MVNYLVLHRTIIAALSLQGGRIGFLERAWSMKLVSECPFITPSNLPMPFFT
jgi:hypothetical protein